MLFYQVVLIDLVTFVGLAIFYFAYDLYVTRLQPPRRRQPTATREQRIPAVVLPFQRRGRSRKSQISGGATPLVSHGVYPVAVVELDSHEVLARRTKGLRNSEMAASVRTRPSTLRALRTSGHDSWVSARGR